MTFKTFFLFLFLPVLFITGCSDNTVSSDSSVSGRFTDEDGQTVEGALVRVFAVKPLDTLVTRLRKEYKDVGCDISDATEFDHRFYGKPLAEGKTKSDGSFSVEGLSGGPYHISITHPQYSWRYIYRTSGSIGDVKTKPVKEINGVLTGNTIWDEAGQDYVVTENATQNGGSLTIKSGVRVRLGSQRKLVVHNGSLTIEGGLNSPVWVTSDTDLSTNGFSAGLQVNSSSLQVSGVVISGGVNGLTCRAVKNGTIENSFFSNNFVGLYITQGNNTFELKKIVALLNSDNSIVIESVKSSITSSIVAYNENIAIKLLQDANAIITNTFIKGNSTAIHMQEQSAINIEYSEILSPVNSIYASNGSSIVMNLCVSGSFTIARTNVVDTQLHSLVISKSNFYRVNAKPVIYIKANTEIQLNHVYFDKTQVLNEYEQQIKDDWGGIKINIIEPIFNPVVNAGLQK